MLIYNYTQTNTPETDTSTTFNWYCHLKMLQLIWQQFY